MAHPLARAKIETELAALMIRRACWLHDHGEPAGESANMAKYAAAEAAIAAADAAMQTHGGNGFATEFGLVPYWASARLLRVAPVNREMILNYVAQHSLGLPGPTRSRGRAGPAHPGRRRGPRAQPHPADQRRRLADPVRRHPAGPARVVDGPRRWTYPEFNAWVNRLAHGLAARGYQRGDALGLASANSAEFLAVYYACAKLGLVCVPINLGWRPDEVAYVLDHSGARGLVAESQLVAHVRDAVAKVPAIADVFVAPGTGAAYDAEPADRSWSALADLAAGSGSAAEPESFVDDRDALSYLYTSGTTSFPKGVVGTHVAIYLESMSSALDSGWNCGDRFAAKMHQLSHIGAVGTPITGVQVAIMNPDGELLPPGEQGEIVYRGPSTMSG